MFACSGSNPRLRKIFKTTGTPRCSIGVIHEGKEVWNSCLGLRDVERGLLVQSDTVFLLHSLSKAITASAFACLVNDGKREWTTPLKSIIPELEDERITPLDLISVRSGYYPANSFAWQGNNIVLLRNEDTVKNWNALKQRGDFRGSFKYNN
jgi:CubicO group peptidase (beta-lactamase class C family)